MIISGLSAFIYMKMSRKIIAIIVMALIIVSYGVGVILTSYIGRLEVGMPIQPVSEKMAPSFSSLRQEVVAQTIAMATPAATLEEEGYKIEIPSERMLVRTASLYMESEDPGDAVNKIIIIVESYGGYISQLNMYSKENPSANLLVKVPEKYFFQALSEIKRVGEVVSEDVNTRDVTEEYIDLEARLRNLRAEEEWLVKMMEKAKNIEELMMVERELWRIRGEIERLEAQTKNLERMVQYSSISITVAKPSEPTSPKPPYPEIDFTPILVAALTALIYIAYGLVFLIIVGIPLGAIAYAGYIIYRRATRRKA